MVNWDDRPPADETDGIRVVSIKPNDKLKALLLDRVIGVWTHWIDGVPKGKSKPCLGDNCPYHQAPIRWRGFVAAAIGKRNLQKDGQVENENIVVELTEHAAKQLIDKTCRGLFVQFSRGPSKFGRITCAILEDCSSGNIPETFDIKPVLYRVWGVRDIKPKVPERRVDNDVLQGPWLRKTS